MTASLESFRPNGPCSQSLNPLTFWAKLPRAPQQPVTFHPLLCHMVDVGAVALTLWQTCVSPAARHRIAAGLGLGDEAAGRWVAFWAGLHDLGKASPAFQLQPAAACLGAAFREGLRRSGLRLPAVRVKEPHGTITADALPDILEKEFSLPRCVASSVAALSGGHHGTFPSSYEVEHLNTEAKGTGAWLEARRDLVRSLAVLLRISHTQVPTRLDTAMAMVLAGLVTVSDWIGSAEEYFPHAVRDANAPYDIDPAAYAESALGKAHRALDSLGWTAWSPAPGRRSFADLFPGTPEPNPLQQEVIELAEEGERPGLVIIEAPMGEGKTEAAMYLTERWSARFEQRGCYFALPTQATSNQMFSRVRRFLAARYPEGRVALQLLHGHAALSAEFESLKRNARLFEPQGIHGEGDGSGSTADIVAAEWFTHRKRGLLAPFGVGTVDQALLAVLQSRHVFVRLFGLAHKTVIVDEVHAYDTYMSTLLERLLEWLAALGSSVVLLSATLSKARRRALVDAYAKGLGRPVAETIPPVAYPRVTWATQSTAGARCVEASTRSAKTVQLEWMDGRLPAPDSEAFALGSRLRTRLAAGGCAAVICNTVGRAQQVYRALKPHFPSQADDGWPELDLLHARYLFEERDRREKRALVRFGRPDGKVEIGDGQPLAVRRPQRAVLVATQIIEQSLDLDFDLMITDLAPADLVLQRAGRLHRHQRERRPVLVGPALWLCEPEGIAGGVPSFGRRTEAVYDDHVLLRSWLALKDRTAIRIPEEVEDLVEAVYGDRPCPDTLNDALRLRWMDTWQRHLDEMRADSQEARERWLKPPGYGGFLWRLTGEPREEDAPEFHRSHQALTRLAEPTVTVVFLYGARACPSLDAAGLEGVNLSSAPTIAMATRLLKRSVPVTDKRIVYSLLQEEVPAGWRQSPLLRHHRLLLLDTNGVATCGKYRLRLDNEVGLSVTE